MKRARHSEVVAATNTTQGMFPMRTGTTNTENNASANLPNTLERCIVLLSQSLSSIEEKQVAGIKAAQEHFKAAQERLQKLLEEHEDVATAQTKLSDLSRQPERCHGIAPDKLLDSIVQCITGGGGPLEVAQDNSSLHSRQRDSHTMLQQNEDVQQHGDTSFGRYIDSFLTQPPSSIPNQPVRRVSLLASNRNGGSQQSQRRPELGKYALAVFQWNETAFESQRTVAKASPVESVRTDIKMLECRLTV